MESSRRTRVQVRAAQWTTAARFGLFIVTTAILVALGCARVLASPSQAAWPPFTPLSTVGVYAHEPDIVADPYGRVHRVWAERSDPKSTCNLDTIMYSVYQDGASSTPRDVLVSPVWPSCVSGPAIAHSRRDDRLHVVWTDYRLYYAWAPAGDAAAAPNWSAPVIVDENARMADIVVDSRGVIHVAYYHDRPDWEVVYVRSEDGGQRWTAPLRIHTAPPGELLNRIDLEVDGRDRLHMVWYDETKAGMNERGGTVYYARSTDGGDTWSPERVVDTKDERYVEGYGAGEITVGVQGDDEVMLVWAGPPSSQRWYQYSADGGDTWSSPALVAPLDALNGAGLRNYNWGMDLAADGAGRFHLVTSGSEHLTHVEWRDGRWLPPQIMFPFETEWTRLAVNEGNQLQVVAVRWDRSSNEPSPAVGVTSSQSDAPAIAPLPAPTTAPLAPVATLTAATPLEGTPTAQPDTQTAFSLTPPPASSSTMTPVLAALAAVVPVLLLVALMIRTTSSRTGWGRRR